MEWKLILTSIISASFIVALIEFFIKQSYVKLLDKKIEEAKEDIRRKSKVYDIQFDTYVLISGLVYRTRNTTRDIIFQLENSTYFNSEIINDLTCRITSYKNAISELMFEKRAILNNEIFKYIHKLNQLIEFCKITTENIKTNDNECDKKQLIKEYQVIYQEIDNLYILINNYIQNEIKVK